MEEEEEGTKEREEEKKDKKIWRWREKLVNRFLREREREREKAFPAKVRFRWRRGADVALPLAFPLLVEPADVAAPKIQEGLPAPLLTWMLTWSRSKNHE